jgi:hypothetical protein
MLLVRMNKLNGTNKRSGEIYVYQHLSQRCKKGLECVSQMLDGDVYDGNDDLIGRWPFLLLARLECSDAAPPW